MKKAVILLSGGIDSVTALYWAKQKREVLAAISFHYGAKHNGRELFYASEHCRTLGVTQRVISLPFIASLFKSSLLEKGEDVPEGHYADENMKSTVVPFRNGIMLSIAAGFSESIGAQALVIAAHAGDHTIYPDCREEFMIAMAKAVRLGTYANIEIERPFIHHHKNRVVEQGAKLGIDYALTWSCYKGQMHHCGKCGACVERKEAFQLANVKDPTVYVTEEQK